MRASVSYPSTSTITPQDYSILARALRLTDLLRHIAKATDENLTSEDWGAIIELCDRVSTDQNGPKEAVQSMIKRLAHRNANVQLYTLEVSLF